MATSIAESLAAVRDRIARAAAGAGRDPARLRLVAVSKTHPVELVRQAWEAGQRDFGESYAQELVSKADALASLEVRWHFVGHLQSNKAKLVAPRAWMVHSVDSASIARELGKRAGRRLPVLVEVNVGGEATKSGCAPGALGAVLEAVEAEPTLVLSGLMTMPPPGDPGIARRTFETLALLRERLGGAARLPELSMGMTDDLEIAVACGATIVRVGTAIFGPRAR